jgi:perosamine synthetase
VLPDTWCLDPSAVEAAITPRTKAILAVHLYGNLCDMDALASIAQRHELHLIEDSAEAIGSIWRGRSAGSMGAFGAFSFHGTKTITTGEGGIFVTNDDALFERVLTLSNHGRARGETRQFWPERIGYKYKMSNVQAAIGCGQMERVNELIAGKRRIFEHYHDALQQLPLRMNPEPTGTTNGYWMPTIVTDAGVSFDRELLLASFKAHNIDGRVFFWPLSSLPMFAPHPQHTTSHALSTRAINLPSYHDMTNEDIERVVACIRSILEANS